MSADGQIKAYFQRWERLEGEKKAISDDLKELFKEAKSFGFDGKALRAAFNRKAKLDEGDPADAQFEMTVDTYLNALNGSPRDARLRTREKIEEFDAETGEVLDPKLAQTEAGRAALIAAVDIMIDRDEADEGEAEGTASGLPTNQPETADQASNGSNADRPSLAARGDEESAVSISPIAPAAHGEAEAPSVERVSPEDDASNGSTDANTGGDYVDAQQNAATEQAGALVDQSPAAPGEDDDDAVEMESVPFQPMKRLHYAHCFPELTKAEHDRLTASIAQVGIEEPIVRMHDVIVDGWARYNIARSLGLAYRVVSYRGNDVLLDVIAWQRAARDFTPTQQRKIAAALAKEIPHRAADIMAAFIFEMEEA
jgi:uncharacterized protein (UPF0335 family)